MTTAAGIWATAGIGMACGAGLYFVAIGGTVIMICVQCVLHINCKLFSLKHTYRINISFIQTENEDEKVKELFGVAVFNKVNVNRGEKTIYNASILLFNLKKKEKRYENCKRQIFGSRRGLRGIST